MVILRIHTVPHQLLDATNEVNATLQKISLMMLCTYIEPQLHIREGLINCRQGEVVIDRGPVHWLLDSSQVAAVLILGEFDLQSGNVRGLVHEMDRALFVEAHKLYDCAR